MRDVIRLIFRNAFRHKLRSTLTALGVTVALLAFCFIHTVIGAWMSGVERTAKNRLVVRNAVSLMFYLPVSYYDSVLSTPGVEKAGYGNWFGGLLRNERVRFQQFAINDAYLDVYPELQVTPEMREKFRTNRQAALVGREVAEKYNIKLGERLQIQGTIFPGLWEFDVVGIFQGRDSETDTRTMYFRWDYLNERNRAEILRQPDHIGFFAVQIPQGTDPAVVSSAIDSKFANSPFETLTETETAFVQGFVSMSSTIITTLVFVSYVVIAIMLLVLTNTMLMSSSERLREYAVLKSLGFSSARIWGLLCGEALVISCMGFVLLCLILTVVFGLPPRTVFGSLVDFFPSFALQPWTLAASAAAALFVGCVAGGIPAYRIARLKVTEALRRVE